MKRPIEFRAWDIHQKKYKYPKLWDNTMPSNWEQHYILEQYTGLKDRNGVKVYEGDVNEDGGVVIWNSSDASFCWDYPNLEVMSMGDEQTWCKVTGNIHESGGGEG